jgi:hypothetical protein
MTTAELAAASLAWLAAHPALDTVVVWPLVTAIVNTVFKDANAYADSHPRLAPLKKLLQKYGVSPRDTFALIVAAATARGLPPPSTGAPMPDSIAPPKGPS